VTRQVGCKPQAKEVLRRWFSGRNRILSAGEVLLPFLARNNGPTTQAYRGLSTERKRAGGLVTSCGKFALLGVVEIEKLAKMDTEIWG
jgi:hypothetical protein